MPSSLSAQSNDPPLRIGFCSSVFNEVNLNDVKAAVKAWAHAVSQESGCPIETDPSIFKGSAEVLDALRTKTCDAFAMSFPEFWELHQDSAFDPIFTTIPEAKTNVEYMLLARQTPQAQDLAKLRGANLLFYQSPKTSLAMPWLEVYLHKNGMEPASSFFQRITSVAKPSAAVLPVFFGKYEACLVDRVTFDTMVELNPQISRDIKPVAVSSGYIAGLFCFRRDYESPSKQKFIDALTNLHTTPAGRQVLLVFRLDKAVLLTQSQLAGSSELLTLYQQLTNRVPDLANAKPLGPSSAASTNTNVKPLVPRK